MRRAVLLASGPAHEHADVRFFMATQTSELNLRETLARLERFLMP
jgi:hypothetical protein